MTEDAINNLVRLADKRMSRGDNAAAAAAVRDAIALLQSGMQDSPSLQSRAKELNRLRRVLEFLETRTSSRAV